MELVYFIVWMDGIVFKVRENSKVINKTIYITDLLIPLKIIFPSLGLEYVCYTSKEKDNLNTTNLIENLNEKIRKYTKSKLPFPTDEAVIKSAYLALRETLKRWTQPIRNRGLILNQFLIIFAERVQL